MLRSMPSFGLSGSTFRLPRTAKGLIALLLLSALTPAQAYTVNVEPTFQYKDSEGRGPMVGSFAQALANYQAYYAWVDQTYGGTRTLSILHPAAGSYTMNGVWAETSFDFTICGANGICNFHPN